MPRSAIRALAGAAVLALGVPAAPATAAEADLPVGGVIEPTYTGATGTRVSGQQRPLGYQERVYSRERVETGESASTRLQFLDESRIDVSANSSLVLDRFVYDPQSQLGSAALRLTKGTLRFVSGQMRNEQNITIRTPTAAIVVRGTDIQVTVDPSGWTELAVTEGTVSLIPCGPNTTRQVEAGMRARVNRSCVTTVSETGELPEAPSQQDMPPGGRPEGTNQEGTHGGHEPSRDRQD